MLAKTIPFSTDLLEGCMNRRGICYVLTSTHTFLGRCAGWFTTRERSRVIPRDWRRVLAPPEYLLVSLTSVESSMPLSWMGPSDIVAQDVVGNPHIQPER